MGDYIMLKTVVDRASAIILDIEGTTTSINFVKDVLFSYAETHLESYVINNWTEEEMKEIITLLLKEQEDLKDVDGFIPLPPYPSDECKIAEYRGQVISHLKWQQYNDLKSTGLKRLQGNIWKEAYLTKEIKGHVYEDVPVALKYWKGLGKKVYIYSSGSVAAQKLLFRNSIYGDLEGFIDGNFDTTSGSKLVSKSYINIANKINVKPDYIVFFTDRPKEVDAAKKSGMTVIRIIRDEENRFVKEEVDFLGKEYSTLDSFFPIVRK